MSEKEAWEREQTWQSLAIAIAVILAIGLAVASGWIVMAPDAHEQLRRVRIASPFGVVGVAAVTFCTILWRGLISARQADAQLTQIDRINRQIAATEESNLAALLQKGAELIGEPQQAHMAAGVASLKAVIKSPNPLFAVEAMDLLADLIQTQFSDRPNDPIGRSAIEALSAGAAQGRTSNRALELQMPPPRMPGLIGYWPPVTGVAKVTYIGGYMRGDELPSPQDPAFRTQNFRHVQIMGGRLDMERFMGCSVSQAEIHRISAGAALNNSFDRCDFSGATIIDGNDFPDLREGENFFEPDNPPVAKRDVTWSEVLLVGDPEDFQPPDEAF